MKNLLRFIAFVLMVGGAYAQSNLPACPSSTSLIWHNCVGERLLDTNLKYVGTFQNNNAIGEGVLYRLDESVVIAGSGSFSSARNSNLSNLQQTFILRAGDYSALIKKYPFNSLSHFPLASPTSSSSEKDRLNVEAEAERKKRQELEQQLAAAKERDRITADLDVERRKRQELEEQLRVAQQRPVSPQTANNSSMGKRIALVVGNANYKVRPLKNSVNDADDVSKSLKATGFEVIDLRDATLPQMRSAVRQFGDRLVSNDVGLVYYSGHGVEVKGRNYFIPVNADIQREDEIADQGLDVSLILEKMSTAGKGVNILIVDACRDDPFGRSFRSSSRGLANMDAPRGTIIAYATSPGKVASDGDPRERNSPYTKHLVRAMQSPNKPIEQVFKEVRRAVQDETKNQQTPWENTSLSGDFFFRVQR